MLTRAMTDLGIDPDAVEEALANNLTFPARWYSDPDIHALELEGIFSRSWQYAGPLCKLAEPGDHIVCQIGRVPILITRDGDRRTARIHQRLPSPRLPGCDRGRQPHARCSAATTPGPTTSTAACERRRAASTRQSSTSPNCACSRSRWTHGTSSSSPTPIPTPRRLARPSPGSPALAAGAGPGLHRLPLLRPLHIRGAGQLEGVGGERQRVLPLPVDPHQELQRRVRRPSRRLRVRQQRSLPGPVHALQPARQEVPGEPPDGERQFRYVFLWPTTFLVQDDYVGFPGHDHPHRTRELPVHLGHVRAPGLPTRPTWASGREMWNQTLEEDTEAVGLQQPGPALADGPPRPTHACQRERHRALSPGWCGRRSLRRSTRTSVPRAAAHRRDEGPATVAFGRAAPLRVPRATRSGSRAR